VPPACADWYPELDAPEDVAATSPIELMTEVASSTRAHLIDLILLTRLSLVIGTSEFALLISD